VSTLRSAIDELAAEDPLGIDVAQLGDGIVELHRARDALDAEIARRVGEFHARSGYEREGHLSMTAWLRARCRLAAGTARGLVHAAGALRAMPLTMRAFSAGELSLRRVRELVRGRDTNPDLFARDEAVLVDAALHLPVRHLRRAVDYWRQAADAAAALADAERQHRRRALHLSETFEGMVRIDGDLDPEAGRVVMTAVAALAEPAGRDDADDRTPAQRRADALVDICRDFLDHGDTPVHGGEKPHVSVVVDLAILRYEIEGRSEYGDGTVVDAETVRRIACDAAVSGMLVSGEGELLDVGRRTRTVPAALRRALVLRDGGCTWEGCDRPARWCDAHHVVHWSRGGATSLDNLRLLCRRHHRLVHRRDRDPP
jgi:hypothetical protein